MKNFCSLHELRSVYSLSDLLSFHEVIVELNQMEQRNATR
uniref:Uncharacterized protein n=1 Tax=Myoviridae sp. ctVDo27 TaxID=2823548 RepID=A0A8S5LHJ9_9CAUD|nr:MAG TPA: hypothetical protein [Myoviridae sp. ctVDo27]DAP91216.1 MAG TPA: hypothetical protein [Caudoviricetes sp.]DAR16777.1 MAG TPA: hypothetical protein [Caudoviricetes sp.]DAW37364.1 MAG TPA: hypothetical protein [Caudoviricetes sp.]DAY11225.1 MAG TPA: hypothetical protein [Caudoviricetes sp.]